MKSLCYVLLIGGIMLALGGVLAVFNFDQPSDVFSLAWWMIVGGWVFALTGMSIDIFQLFAATTRKPLYAFQPELDEANGVQKEISRV